MAAVSIAFEAPDNCGGAPAVTKKPIDFDHLARQTMGDKDLEIEVLQLFSRNARAALHEIADDKAVRATAHRLKGAAQAVGAPAVSAAAAAVEDQGKDSAAIAKLAATIVEAENFILKLCR